MNWRIPSLLLLLSAVAMTWPGPATGWTLQQSSDFDAANWMDSTNLVRVAGINNQVIVSTPTTNLFYRLIHR